MKTVTFGSKSVGRINGGLRMQIVDHEEMVEEEPVEDECVIEEPYKGFNPESTGSMVLMDSVK